MNWDVEKIRELEALSEEECARRIRAIREKMGSRLILLAHLYQRKSIADLADFVGDSYGLSYKAAHSTGGETIVFCGVRFMAESAAILCRPDQSVVHPDPEAGCPMADMASLEEVTRAWTAISPGPLAIPVTYMNSTADIKAFCGEHGGIVCTSSNASKVFDWAFERGRRIFFLPDEHLGRNTALKYGIPPSQITVWDPQAEGEPDTTALREARVILWRGFCPVHQRFTPRDVQHVRRFYPQAKVIVHPEVPHEVAELADAMGSTEFIRTYVRDQTKPGDLIFIGTEWNLIRNLALQYPDRKIEKLHRSLCLTMYQITMGRLLYTLENLDAMERVQVSPSVKEYSRLALDRMLALG